MFVIAGRARRVWDRIRSPRIVVRILLGAVLVAALSAAVLFFLLPMLRQAPSTALGTDLYVSGQRQLRLTEAAAHLAVLRNDLVAGRPTRDLTMQYARIRSDLELAMAGTGAESVANDLWSHMDRLREQIQEEDPRAAETVAEVERLLGRTHEAATASPDGEAGLRTAYLSSEQLSASILIQDVELFVGLRPGDVSGYRTISAGESVATVVEHVPDEESESADSSEEVTPAYSADPETLTLEPGVHYTLLLIEAGSVPNEDRGEGRPELLVELIADELGGWPPAGGAWLRVVHVATGVDLVTAAISETGDARAEGGPAARESDEALPSGESVAIAESVAFGETGGYAVAPFGRQRVEFRSSGDGTTLYGPIEIDLRPGAAYTLFLFGDANEGELSVVMSVDALLRGSVSDVEGSPAGAR